jgi:23S rRNA (guanine2445-N2)-methyltransferase / 23S rRNA (guanine2069-N7)-methyltransferase
MLRFFATCPKGIESLLLDELRSLGALSVKETRAGVSFEGTLETALAACLWSRLANRILLPLSTFSSPTPEALYGGVKEIVWEDHLPPDGTLAVDAVVSGSAITHSRYAALKTKDAVVDRFRERTGSRPSVKTREPDLQINVHIHKDEATISLDLSGDSLHRRGYRTVKGEAPLKENLAAAILIRARWPQLAAEGRPFIDPMCGSGTLAIEAALMAADIAPGLLRSHFGFLGWKGFESRIWTPLQVDARYRKKEGLPRLPGISGFDHDKHAVSSALANLKRAGLEGRVHFEKRSIENLVVSNKQKSIQGLIVVNPPYGERIGEVQKLRGLYHELGTKLREDYPGWNASVFTGNPELGMELWMRAHRTHTLYNGPIKCRLLHFKISEEWFYKEVLESTRNKAAHIVPKSLNGEMFANRLRKNMRITGKWAKKEGISCYRLYDADIPEYNLAVDIYQDMIHIQEYRAPDSVDPTRASDRLQDALVTVREVLDVAPEHIYLKVRQRQRGTSQYERMGEGGKFHEVREGQLKFLVNLEDYLDTGLFLDHRLTRRMVGKMARGKSFLNLFAYTGAATVYAAAGGASSTTTVDMSSTYLNWARRNMALNAFGGRGHRFTRADCLSWIAREKKRYDLVFLDPPTFSTSKSMESTFDVQRDHVQLIKMTADRLTKDGILIFSNNRRRFEMDIASLNHLRIEDITGQTIPKDFARSPRIHNCWLIRKK